MTTPDCVVNVGFGGWHPRGSARLEQSLIYHGFPGRIKCWTNSLPPGCPPHLQEPYAMKLYAIQWAVDEGHQRIWWMDSSVWAMRPPDHHRAVLDLHGYYLLGNGEWKCDQWTNDACLAYFGLTREQAAEIPMITAGILGLDLSTDIAREFFRQWWAAMRAGAFRGAWTAAPSEGSGERYRGHRHDQASASIIAHRMGMILQPDQVHDCYYREDMPDTVELALRGM